MRWCCALVLAIMVARAPAHAERIKTSLTSDVCTHYCGQAHTATCPVSTKRRAAAIGLAIFPGVIGHGIGAWTVHEKRAAKKIALGEAIGLGVAGIAGAFVGGSGGNKWTVFPGIPLVMAGSGLFLQSWFTDIWVAAGGERLIEQPRGLA